MNKSEDIGEVVSWEQLKKESTRVDIVASKEQLKEILPAVGNEVSEQGLVIDSETKDVEETNAGDDAKFDEFGGLLSTGSKVFIKNNLASFSDHIEHLKERKKKK